ncbi:hypothetical protein [Enterococcus sp. LJL90]
MVFVTFEELKRELKHRVITLLCASIEFITESTASDAFEVSDSFVELKHYCQRKYPSGDIPFLDVDRISDEFTPKFLKELKLAVEKR